MPVEVIPAGFSAPPDCALRTDCAFSRSKPRAHFHHATRSAASPAPKINLRETEHHGGRPSCGDRGPEENLVAEAVEPADEVSGGALARLLIEEGLTEFTKRNALREQVEGRN